MYSWTEQYLRYICTLRTLIDLLTILPYYLQLDNYPNAEILAVFRIFRLYRVARQVDVFGDISSVLYLTVKDSRCDIEVLCWCISVMLVFFGCVFYACENGSFSVISGYSGGVYTSTVYGSGTVVSSFNSIPSAIYFAAGNLSTGKSILYCLYIFIIVF